MYTSQRVDMLFLHADSSLLYRKGWDG
jgi:hypothetical protein